jgi:hypothetical protein
MNETERDPRVDAAWRSVSREEPSAVIDAAIRTAARRAVEASPRRSRGKHWWYPLAAAATVAVIAVGLLQLTPPEHVVPVAVTGTIGGLKPETEPAPAASAPPASAPAVPASAFQAPDATAPPRGPAPAPKAVGAESTSPRPGTLEKDVEQTAPAGSAGALRGAPRSEPFPAAAAPQSAAPETPPASAREAGALESPSAAAQAQNATGAPSPPAARKASRALTAVPVAQEGPSPARDQASAQAKLKPTQRSVDDWVKLIRDLRSEGRFDEAARELAAFHEAYGERADALLPADLRGLPAPAPK